MNFSQNHNTDEIINKKRQTGAKQYLPMETHCIPCSHKKITKIFRTIYCTTHSRELQHLLLLQFLGCCFLHM